MTTHLIETKTDVPTFGGLHGLTALVTGASSGLGAHFAATLARAGARVILCARRIEALEETTRLILDAGGEAVAAPLDVTSSQSIRAIDHHLSKVDILVNNAGVVRQGAAFDYSEEDWDVVIDTNLKGMFLMAQAAAKAMWKAGRTGTIINIASILGQRQAGGALPYAVSKAGVVQLTKTLPLELARFGTRVNAISPGYIDTDLNRAFLASEAGQALVRRIPQRRLGCLHDLNGPLLLLASSASSYMTGAVIAVDGGHLVSSL